MLSSQTQFRHLKMQVQRKLVESLRLAEEYFSRKFPMPVVSYDLRGVKAGVAYLQKNEVKFNRTLLLENSDEFIRQVVPHELAHLIVYQMFGRVKPHGAEWKALMNQVFHLPADICHQFDVQNVQGKTFEYRCLCQTHLLTTRRHHRILKEKAEYLCRKCKGKLRFVEDT
ncbi:SprT family zinc-dependent metalloprotease [Rodentibacter haemolyticus]|uniref:Protein SprT n=1 Tax=Rodentibacter haemolyticus TaxID=2778911 RepID=A0ABX6UW87_9PAST|nr:SprT family zinc-dependent metalloprotease [Rodentibacter haemolyticus]QPB42279.1 SprT family zinc-dependent metalloprotease [Rodentibacter haemolyticus]